MNLENQINATAHTIAIEIKDLLQQWGQIGFLQSSDLFQNTNTLLHIGFIYLIFLISIIMKNSIKEFSQFFLKSEIELYISISPKYFSFYNKYLNFD